MWFDDRSVTLPSASVASTSAGADAGPAHDADAAAAGSSGKKAEKKAAAKAAKEAKKAANAAKQAAQASSVDENDPLKHRYGDAEMIQSKNISGKTWTTVRDLDLTKKDQEVLVRARVQAVRGKGKSAFLVLRSESFTVQAILFVDDVTVSKGMVKYNDCVPTDGSLRQRCSRRWYSYASSRYSYGKDALPPYITIRPGSSSTAAWPKRARGTSSRP